MTEVAHDANCVFCRVVAGDQPAHEVLRDDVVVAFLDRSPLFVGHTLVVPLGHAETMGDLTPELVGPYYERVRRLSIVMERSLDADGTFIAHNNRVSQSVPHLHAHVIRVTPRTASAASSGPGSDTTTTITRPTLLRRLPRGTPNSSAECSR